MNHPSVELLLCHDGLCDDIPLTHTDPKTALELIEAFIAYHGPTHDTRPLNLNWHPVAIVDGEVVDRDRLIELAESEAHIDANL